MRSVERMKIIEMLRLSGQGMSQRQIAASSGCGKTTVGRVLSICQSKGVTYETAARMTEAELHCVMYPKCTENTSKPHQPGVAKKS